MVQRGVCISSEGFDPTVEGTVEGNFDRLFKFVQSQEDLRREKEWSLLADTALELSVTQGSGNPTEVAGVPNVSTGGQSSEAFTPPETDAVAMQMQTDFADQQPTDSVDQQPRGSAEQELDSGRIFESQIKEVLITSLRNENYYEGLGSIESFLIFNELVSPAYIQLIANAILTIVNKGIQSEGLPFANFFLQNPWCLDILNRAIDMEPTQTVDQLTGEVEILSRAIGLESIQIAGQLKEGLKDLFIQIRDEVVNFNSLVSGIQNTNSESLSIGQDNLSFLKLIYPQIINRGSQVNEIIIEVFAEPFDQWVQALIKRITEIKEQILQTVNESEINQALKRLQQLQTNHTESSLGLSLDGWSEYESIKNTYKGLEEKVVMEKRTLTEYRNQLGDLGINTVLTELDRGEAEVDSLLSNLGQITNFRIW